MDDASDFDFDEQLANEEDHMQPMEEPVLLPPSEDEAEEAAPVLLPLQVAAPEEPVIVADADVAARSPSPTRRKKSSPRLPSGPVSFLSCRSPIQCGESLRRSRCLGQTRGQLASRYLRLNLLGVHSSVLQVWNQSSGFRGSGQVGGLSSGVSITCIGESG